METPIHDHERDVLLDITPKATQETPSEETRPLDNKSEIQDLKAIMKNESEEAFEKPLIGGFSDALQDMSPQTNQEEVQLQIESSDMAKPQIKSKKKKKPKKAAKQKKEEELPVFKCPKEGHNDGEVTHVCTLPECPKRLLCSECLKTDHASVGAFKKPFKTFLYEAQNMEIVKDQKIDEFEEFLSQKENFMKNLDYNYDNLVRSLNKEFEAIREAVTTKLMQVKEKVLETKKKTYNEIKKNADEYEKKFNETYFDVDAKIDEAITSKKDNYQEFEKLCHDIIEAPNFKQREELINFSNNLTSKIKVMEDNFYNRRLKFVQTKIKKDIYKLLDDVIQGDHAVSTVTEFEWNPKSIEMIKYSHTGAPVLALCEMEKDMVAASYGFPENAIEVFDTKEMKMVKRLKGHSKSVTALMYMPASKTLVSASCDQYVKGWNIELDEPVWTIKAHQHYIFALGKLEDDVFATGSHDKFIKIWKIGKNTPRSVLYGHSDAVWCVIALQEPEMLGSCSADGRIIIWDYESAESIRRIKAHKDQVNQIIAHDKTQLISASDDNTVKLWDWRKAELIAQLLNIQNPVWGILVAHDNETLFCYGEQANVVVYNMEESTVTNVLYGFDQMIKTMIETSDHFIVTGSYDYKIRYWNSVKME